MRKKRKGKPKNTKNSSSDSIPVCPKCLNPARKTASFMALTDSYQCNNEECNWAGSFILEVKREDYVAFVEEHKGVSKDRE